MIVMLVPKLNDNNNYVLYCTLYTLICTITTQLFTIQELFVLEGKICLYILSILMKKSLANEKNGLTLENFIEKPEIVKKS